MKIDTLEQSVSMIVRMVSKPPDCGSFVMKSIVMVLKGQALSAGVMGNIGGWVVVFILLFSDAEALP